jgi:hypothetical protein
VSAFDSLVKTLLDLAFGFARACGFSGLHVTALANIGARAETPPMLMADEVSRDFAAFVSTFTGSVRTLVTGALKLMLALAHIVVLTFAGALQLTGKFIRAIPWKEDSGWAATLGEQIESFLGDFAGSLYESFGTVLEGLILPRTLDDKPVVITPVHGKSPMTMFLDAMATVMDLDAACAAELQRAYESSHAQTVNEDWRGALERVSRNERWLMSVFESIQDKVFYLEWSSRSLKAAVKVAQAFAFAWTLAEKTLTAALAKFVKGVGERFAALKPLTDFAASAAKGGPLDLAGKIELAVDVLELAVIRVPLVSKEVGTLACLYCAAPNRIRGLYDR